MIKFKTNSPCNGAGGPGGGFAGLNFNSHGKFCYWLHNSGELVVDTSGNHTVGETIKFKSMSGIPPQSALVIKLPK